MDVVRPGPESASGPPAPADPGQGGGSAGIVADARTLIGALAGGFVAAILVGAAVMKITDSLIALGMAGEAGFFVGAVAFLAANRQPLRRVFRAGSVPPGVYFLAVMLGLALLVANLVTTVLLGPSPRDVEMLGQVQGVLERVMLAVGVVVVAPIVEEALFRGLLQGVLERWTSGWVAILAAGLAFALMHAPGPGPIFFFLWSIPVGWITWRTGSIRPAVVVHMVNNLAGVLAFLASSPRELEEPPPDSWPVGIPVALLLLAVVWVFGLSRRIAARADETRVIEGS